MENNLDKQYLDIMRDILENGNAKGDRTGTGTKSLFGKMISHDMSEGFPILTSKKVHFKSVVGEALWFLSGSTDIRDLWKMGIRIWDGDWFKRFSKSHPNIELDEVKKDTSKFNEDIYDMNKIYGWQWRKWGAEKVTEVSTKKNSDGYLDYNKKIVGGIDQVTNAINLVKNNPDSRRIMVNAWNVAVLDDMLLPPCHFQWQLYVNELPNGTKGLSLMYNTRSQDFPLGTPFNISSYGFILEILSKITGCVPDKLIGVMGDTHIYLNQIDGAKKQLEVTNFYKLPKLVFPEHAITNGTIDDFLNSVVVDDFKLDDYQHNPHIKYPLSN